MEEERETSIEFQAMNDDPQSNSQVRNSFRVPLSNPQKYVAVIKNFPYPLLDIANGGAGFEIKYEPGFTVGDILEACRLELGDHTIEGLRGEVVHLFAESDITWKCGIRWINLADKAVGEIAAIVLNLRKELFRDSRTSLDRDLELKR
jgi:c-di-GMP-binding flagellar brake protein YcgR